MRWLMPWFFYYERKNKNKSAKWSRNKSQCVTGFDNGPFKVICCFLITVSWCLFNEMVLRAFPGPGNTFGTSRKQTEIYSLYSYSSPAVKSCVDYSTSASSCFDWSSPAGVNRRRPQTSALLMHTVTPHGQYYKTVFASELQLDYRGWCVHR